MPFAATQIALEIIILSEVSQRKKNNMILLMCEIQSNDTDDKTETNSQTWKTDLWLLRV